MLSVILPAFNEEMTLSRNVASLQEKLDALDMGYEIIIVDDGSNDRTREIAQSLESDTVRVAGYEQNRGKGYAIRHGMQRAGGDYRLFMDVDLSTDLRAVEEFMKKADEDHCDVIIGSRRMRSDSYQEKQPWARRFFGEGFRRLSQWMTGSRISDFTCGFKMYSRQAAEIIFSRQRICSWAFDTELIYIALLHRLNICEVPVLWRNDRRSKVRLFRDITGSLWALVLMKMNYVRGFYQ